MASNRNAAPDNAVVDSIKRDISDLRLGQTRNRSAHPGLAGSGSQYARSRGRPAGDDRRRSARPARRAGAGACAGACSPPHLPRCRQGRSAEAGAAAAVGDAAASGIAEPGRGRLRVRAASIPAAAAGRARAVAVASRSLHDILDPRPAAAPAADAAPAAEPRGPQRMAIDPELPPDHPLEPGTRPHGRVRPRRRSGSPPRRDAISDIPAAKNEPTSSSNFIAAARRAAQAAAAAAQPTDEGAGRQEEARRRRRSVGQRPRLDARLQDPLAAGRRQRGGDRARHLQDGDAVAGRRQRAGAGRRRAPAQPLRWRRRRRAGRAGDAAAPAQPSMTSPTPIDRQSLFGPATAPTESRAAPGRRCHRHDPGAAAQPRRRQRCRPGRRPCWFRFRPAKNCPRRSAERRCAPPR